MKNVITAIGSLLICVLIISCKSAGTMIDPIVKSAPESYPGPKDSINSALLNRHQFFNDSILTGLIDTALQNNPDLLMTLQKIEIARADMRMNKGALFPAISAGGSFAQRKFGRYTMDGAGNITTEMMPGQMVPIHLPDYYMGLQASWEADIWGKIRNRKKAAVARYLKSIEGKNMVTKNLVAEIAITYYELLSLDKELDIIRETIKLQQNAFDIVSIQKQAAVTTELAVKQFEAQLLNSKSLEIEVMQKITENENKINFLLGRFPVSFARDKSVFTNSIPAVVKVGVPSELLQNRSDVRQAELELIAAKADVKSARAAFYPAFNITGAIGFQSFNTEYLLSTPQSVAYSLMGNLTAPLINRSAIEARFKTAQAMQIEALLNYQKTIITAYLEVNNEMANIKNLEKIYDLKNMEVAVLTQSIETSSELFKTGRATYLEVLMTQQKSLQSNLELINTKKRQYHSVIKIYSALGGGWK